MLRSLDAGFYTAHLSSGEIVSKDNHFEVVNERTCVNKHGQYYIVIYGSLNSVPSYLVICSQTGKRVAIIDFDPDYMNSGYVLLQGNYQGLYLKVFYQGRFGRVSNVPLLLP